jgi:uncharacterized protein
MSPCEQICKLNNYGICLGCGRTSLEIEKWSYLSEAEQIAFTELAKVRLKTVLFENERKRH